MTQVKLTFCSGVGTATGANFLMETPEGIKILVDCGLEQGSQFAEKNNYEAFSYTPADIKFLFITHAHADHIGRIPKLVKDGFRGVIYSTPETKRLSEVMLPDIVNQITREAQAAGHPPLYTEADVRESFSLWHEMPYHVPQDIAGFKVSMRDAGHILGSAMITFERNGKNIVFTGDLGNSPAPLLKDTEAVTDATYMVMESVYGDRNHESKAERRGKLKQAILDTYKRGGTMLIPCFSMERTQVILYEINRLEQLKEIPTVPLYLDSPLAEKITAIYSHYTNDFNANIQQHIAQGM